MPQVIDEGCLPLRVLVIYVRQHPPLREDPCSQPSLPLEHNGSIHLGHNFSSTSKLSECNS